MNTTHTSRNFHGETVEFMRHRGNLKVRVSDIAKVLGLSGPTSLINGNNYAPTTMETCFYRSAYGVNHNEAISLVNGANSPSVLKVLFSKWLTEIYVSVDKELVDTNRPVIGDVPFHLRSGLITVRAFMAMHNFELTDGAAQRLGLKATRIRDSKLLPVKKVGINIQTSSGDFVVRQENLYQYSVIKQAFNEMFV